MRATGIVAEFNPLHNGHEYMMKEARRITDADAVVIAMSGNFVQRGEPAILDKWSRTECALANGADLVFEIPTLFCLRDAGAYASAAVRMLESLNCIAKICCGCRAGDSEIIKTIANVIIENRNKIDSRIKEAVKSGMSYPASREEAVLSFIRSDADKTAVHNAMNNPNNILAIEYILAAESSAVECISRAGADYNDSFSSELEFQSAGGIRELIKEKGVDTAAGEISHFVPGETLDKLRASGPIFKDMVSDYLRLSLINADASFIDECPSGGEGLGNLLKDAAVLIDGTEGIIAYAKSKRYTYTRLSRLCMQILLGIDRRKYASGSPEYLRVLGFNEKGRELLSEVKRNKLGSLPIITNINKEFPEPDSAAESMLRLDIKASDIYNLMSKKEIYDNSDYKRIPVMTGL